jgi:hypothetical protein
MTMPPRKTTEAAEKPAARKRANPQKWVRNLTLAQVAFRIGGSDGRRVELKPRGHRGDLAQVSKEELSQLADVDSIYEVITDTEAKTILSKQTTNQQAYHPALNAIRNSKGEQYQQAVVVATEEEAQGITVAHIEGNDPYEGNKKNIKVERVSTTDVMGPKRVAVPGSTEYADQVARQKGGEGPQAGGINRVVLEPRQKG